MGRIGGMDTDIACPFFHPVNTRCLYLQCQVSGQADRSFLIGGNIITGIYCNGLHGFIVTKYANILRTERSRAPG